MRGEIANTYASKLTGWHGNKLLGFDMHLDQERHTVAITAQAAVDVIRGKLFTKENFKIQPRHIVTEAVYEKAPGEVPDVGDPERSSYLERQATTRSVLGAGIWLQNAYPQITSGINAMCVDMANPSDDRLGQLRHMFMYLGDTPPGKTFGGSHVSSICCSDEPLIEPFREDKKEGRWHFFSSGNTLLPAGPTQAAVSGKFTVGTHLRTSSRDSAHRVGLDRLGLRSVAVETIRCLLSSE